MSRDLCATCRRRDEKLQPDKREHSRCSGSSHRVQQPRKSFRCVLLDDVGQTFLFVRYDLAQRSILSIDRILLKEAKRLECGDLSPLSSVATCRDAAGEVASDQSADRSAHSKSYRVVVLT